MFIARGCLVEQLATFMAKDTAFRVDVRMLGAIYYEARRLGELN